MEAAHATRQPERYGRYVLLERIGQGGMAEVFRAVARGTEGFQRILVVKRILPEMCRDPRFVQMFIDEAKICALISHPNVVQVYEFGRIGESHFLTMEYVHGRNLSAIMEKLAIQNRLPPPDVICEIARQACLGLHHAHTMVNADGKPLQIIHRDVTPANLMVGFNGAVKVLDFGIARAADEVKETRTQAGAVKGKVAYLAPEQINRKPIDHRIDVFAMGIVLHECLTGQRLFKADNPLAAMKAILDMPVPPPSSINAAVSKRVDQIVARALSRDPELRYQNAKAMALDLESALHELRYFSQRLPNFLRELFKDDVTGSKDRILPQEMSAISSALAESDAVVARQEDERITAAHAPGGRGTEDLELPASGAARAVAWLGASRRRLVGVGVASGGLVALSLFLFATRSPAKPPAAEPPPAPAPAPVESEPTSVQISVDSFPQGATILGPNEAVLGTTPHTLSMERNPQATAMVLRLEGFKDVELTVIPDIDKPVFAKLEAQEAPGAARAAPDKPVRKAGPRVRRPAVPLDPFAD